MFQIKTLSSQRPGEGDRPKGFSGKVTHCVLRQRHIDNILSLLEEAVAEKSKPGVYMSGPAGAGKSILAYMVSQICKYDKEWLMIYVADCRVCAAMAKKPVQAKGFFLDRVLESLSTEKTQAFSDFAYIYDKLKNPPALKIAPREGIVWSTAAKYGEHEKCVNDLYNDVTTVLESTQFPILFVCDEINSLWGN